jgi:hypothetical protein
MAVGCSAGFQPPETGTGYSGVGYWSVTNHCRRERYSRRALSDACVFIKFKDRRMIKTSLYKDVTRAVTNYFKEVYSPKF